MAKFDVTGLSIKDISNLSKKQIDSLSKTELSNVTSRLVSAMNKRIRYLGKSDIGRLSPTYQAYERRKSKGLGRQGFYSVRGKDKQDLKNMFQQLSKSLSSDVTTVRGWKRHRLDVFDQIGYDFQNDTDREKKFWELYRKAQEQDPNYKNYRKEISDKVLTYIANEIGSDFSDSEENIQMIKDKIDELYEEIKGEEDDQEKETGVSQFFTDGGNQ